MNASGRDDGLLRVEDLVVSFPIGGRHVPVVDHVSFSLARGEVLGLVGESGSGKTVTAQAVMGLAQRRGAKVSASEISIAGRDVRSLSRSDWSAVRGLDIAMIFQQPTRALNPAFTVGEQIAEVVRRHTGCSRSRAWDRAVEMLDRVQIPDAAARARDYPHMFSGGMCQRVMIAMALACSPKVLIADEPTTALDVTVQAKVLELLRELREDLGMAMVFITHDLGVVADMCERVVVMYAGQLIEDAPTSQLFASPVHPYTRGLIASVPRLGASGRMTSIPGTVPQAGSVTDACRFHPRCAYAVPGLCDVVDPAYEASAPGRFVRCVRQAEITRALELL